MTADIAAVVLAAGFSQRMGMPKLLLPWNDTTVLGQVVSTLSGAGISQIMVVTGGYRREMESHILQLARIHPVHAVHNSGCRSGGMLSSLKVGLSSLDPTTGAALVVLGDQPQMKVETVRQLVDVFSTAQAPLVIPSCNHRRGHPWLVASSLWLQIHLLPARSTLQDFIASQSDQVTYVQADESILQDLDTPQDYQRWKS